MQQGVVERLRRGTRIRQTRSFNISSGLSQNVVRRNGHGRKSERCDRVPAGHRADAGVAAPRGLAAHLNTISFEVHEPGLRNADAGVEGELDVGIPEAWLVDL